MKKTIFNLLFGGSRKLVFGFMFTESEQTAVINALYRRVDDNTTKEVIGETKIKETCKKIATELMS